jgi:hypothetical protein
MKSVMHHQFSQVPSVEIPRSVFNRSHGHKTTFSVGDLVPFYVDEILPGDTFHLSTTLFCRIASPLKYPIMDNLFLETFFFFVPNRLVWRNWARMMGEQDNPTDSIDYLVPQKSSGTDGGWTADSFEDHLGLPTMVENLSYSCLWQRAYRLIWNQWFRDQNLQDSVPVDTGDGPDTASSQPLLKRGKRHDYFTGALPWAQKGSPVTIPLGTSAPVIGNGRSLGLRTDSVNVGLFADNSFGDIYAAADAYAQPVGTAIVPATYPNDLRAMGVVADPVNSGLIVDLDQATAATVNALREAFQWQRMLERDARGGTRYIELIRSHFGVTSPDARLQRPEYLGGSSARINVNPVQQTSQTTTGATGSPQGQLTAYAVTADSGAGFSKSFVEHGMVIGLVNVRGDITYQQGIPRMFSRLTRLDHFFPSLQNLGEQEILNKEIFAQGTAEDEETWGFQERYAEYRYYPSKVTGRFRSTHPTPLDAWHLSEEFPSLPSLNDDFIMDATPMSRVVAVTSEPHFLLDAYLELRCARPMGVYSVPGLIDHF